MPPLAKCRLPLFQSLADELIAADPTSADVLALAGRLCTLAAEIDQDALYAEGWLAARVTGHANAVSAAEPTDGDASIPGAAALLDLSTLAERVSAAAGLGPDDLPDGTRTTDELCAAWCVSRKSLARFRRDGLIALRARMPTGTRTVDSLVFTPDAVAAFEAARPHRLTRASTFARTNDDTTREIIEAATELRKAHGRTLNQAAAELAPRHGLSTEGVRQILKRGTGGHAAFPERLPRSGRARTLALRLACQGLEPADIASRLITAAPTSDPSQTAAVSPRAATRLTLQARLRLLRRHDLRGPTLPGFDRPDGDEVILAPDAVRAGLAPPAEATTLGGWLDTHRRTAAPVQTPAETERARLIAMHYLHASASRITQGLRPGHPDAGAIDLAETKLRWAWLLRWSLLRPLLAGVIESAEVACRGGTGADRAPLAAIPGPRLVHLLTAAVREAAALVAGYSPARGGRLAAAVSLRLRPGASPAIDALRVEATARAEGTARKASAQLVRETPFPDLFRASAPASWRPRLAPPGVIRDADPGSALARRLGLAGDPPRTLTELAAIDGNTPMAIARRVRAELRGRLDAARVR